MKSKTIKIAIGIIILVIVVLSIIYVSLPKETFKLSMNLKDKINIKAGEEVIIGVNFNEDVVGCNFEISYDKEILEFIESETAGLYASVNGENLSCIYIDIAQIGTKTLNLKFKILKETEKSTKLNLVNSKFRTVGKEESYINKTTSLTIK